MTIQQALGACALFQGFSDKGLVLLASIATSRQVPAGTPVFVENMHGDSLVIVAAGRLGIEVRSHGQRVLSGELGPGEHLGQMALVKPGPRHVTATALVPCEIVEIGRGPFLKLQAARPQACLKLLLAICEDFGQHARNSAAILSQLMR